MTTKTNPLNILHDLYVSWLRDNNITYSYSADDLLYDVGVQRISLTSTQIDWLEKFCDLWQATETY